MNGKVILADFCRLILVRWLTIHIKRLNELWASSILDQQAGNRLTGWWIRFSIGHLIKYLIENLIENFSMRFAGMGTLWGVKRSYSSQWTLQNSSKLLQSSVLRFLQSSGFFKSVSSDPPPLVFNWQSWNRETYMRRLIAKSSVFAPN